MTGAAKRQRTDPEYELLYHPGIPGRGEFIRLAFQATGTSYRDPANDDPPNDSGANGYGIVQKLCTNPDSLGEDGNPPVFAPPALRVSGAGKNGKDLIIHQTSNILLFLGPKLGLVGSDEQDLYHVNQLALTALDLNNEIHDTHHPVSVMSYYEDQKPESLKKASDVRQNRIPKYLSYFERALNSNSQSDHHLIGDKLTYADTTLWQLLDGLQFAFPKEMEARRKEFPGLFGTFYPAMKEQEWLKGYLEGGKRKPYSMGVFRHYPELDRQE